MRPDEHKKKKNAQYKKKHGINESKAAENKHDKQKSQTQEKENKQPKREFEERRSNRTQNDVDPEINKASFGRRQVVSNWDRYDEPEVEDVHIGPTSRGEDFLKLLDSAGAASAQFRFKDEEAWEDEEIDQSDGNCLNLDLASLASSLSCIPLHERLGLDHSLFTEEERTQMTDTAAKATSVCTSANLIVNGSMNASRKEENDSNKTVIDQKCNTVSDSSKKHTSPKTCVAVSSELDAKECSTTKCEIDKKGSGSIDDDLDFLLSLDTPSVTVAKSTATQSTSDTNKIEEDKAKKHSGDEDLEDWLDSILD